jgi:hypothetical protein
VRTNDFFNRKTFSAYLKYGFRFKPGSVLGDRYPYAVQGVGIAGNTFFNKEEIGNPIALYVFQSSRIATLSESLSLDYEWNFGASFGWKKYDEYTNPNNMVVGSRVNAYINLGILFDWRLTNQLNLKTGIGFSHFSNGNTSYPNAGVNTACGNIALAWDFSGRNPVARTATPNSDFSRHMSYDVVLYCATRKKGFLMNDNSAVIVPGSFAVTGINISPMYNFSKYFRAGLSLDAQYDESANISRHVANTSMPSDEDIRFHRPPFREQFAIGVSARTEIVMPVFSINIGIGRNLICKGSDTDSFYQIFALKTDIAKNTFLHIGYQLYKFKKPNNLMIGIGYRFK